eukprot:CAMPEP_0184354904 /NCGR_PEP_ID=MMETSP1089-20130417/91931_1 /TAXON_ID=38269 ORGANISM="Gloeochaete wittrockiana, Strain SAG46.84" /NCGR_SAMPLE_ID=MMETSP1089 /ASSEMBLY_ACC=CAM_ASM_000445 /LENGTH=44 /DNA_ID= /DNA_START= /DNA_END= /DNA_ORIENTATION=
MVVESRDDVSDNCISGGERTASIVVACSSMPPDMLFKESILFAA